MDPTTTPINITVAHPDHVSGADILNIINSTVDNDAPLVLQAIPSASPRVAAYVTAGEIGLAILNQIVQSIHAHSQATAAK